MDNKETNKEIRDKVVQAGAKQLKKISRKDVPENANVLPNGRIVDMDTGETLGILEVDVSANKVPERVKLLCITDETKKGSVGVSVLRYTGVMEKTGYLSVMGFTQPVVTRWFKHNEIPTDIDKFRSMPLMSDVVAVLSGTSDFAQMHKLLTVEEYERFRSILD